MVALLQAPSDILLVVLLLALVLGYALLLLVAPGLVLAALVEVALFNWSGSFES